MVATATFSTVDSLYKNLTSGHNKYLRPESDLDSSTNISMNFHIITLQEVNAVEGYVSMNGYFTAMWTDENMKWNPSDYGNTQCLILPYDQIWNHN